MAFTLGDRDVRPLTADEVLRMVDAGNMLTPRAVDVAPLDIAALLTGG